MSVDRPKKKSNLVPLLTVAVVVILGWALCRDTGTPSNSGPKTYTVNKSTGLYDALDVDANMIAELSVGTKLKPANGASSLSCTKLTDAGMEFNLCYVEVVSSGQEGYVLRQWID